MVKTQNESKAVAHREKTLEQTSNPVEPGADTTPAAASTEPKEAFNGAQEPQSGDKRPFDDEKRAALSTEDASKKQKAEEENPSPANVNTTTDAAKDPTTSTNGEKKKAGRPKKGVKDLVKKITPGSGDGIGSRTRSRAKLSE